MTQGFFIRNVTLYATLESRLCHAQLTKNRRSDIIESRSRHTRVTDLSGRFCEVCVTPMRRARVINERGVVSVRRLDICLAVPVMK